MSEAIAGFPGVITRWAWLGVGQAEMTADNLESSLASAPGQPNALGESYVVQGS